MIVIYDYPQQCKHNIISFFTEFFSLFINQDDVSSLRAKITVLEEELSESRQDSSEHQNLIRKLENVLCERLLDLADSGYAVTIFAYSPC